MEIKNYAELYVGDTLEPDNEDLKKLNEWLSEKGVTLEIKPSTEDVAYILRIFKEY